MFVVDNDLKFLKYKVILINKKKVIKIGKGCEWIIY